MLKCHLFLGCILMYILEVGSGTGNLTVKMLEKVKKVSVNFPLQLKIHCGLDYDKQKDLQLSE